MATVQAPVTLDLQPTHEEQMLREAVRGIASGFGPDYIREQALAGEPPTELWDALASRGYLGRQPAGGATAAAGSACPACSRSARSSPRTARRCS